MNESPEHDDWRLVERVRAGEDPAFESLMERYKRPVLNFIFRLIGDATEAQDAAQETFVRAYHGLRRPAFRRGSGAFSTWLFRVARNVALDIIRKRRRRPASPLPDPAEGDRDIAAPGGTPEDDAERAELGRAIARAVAELPEDQRCALVLVEYEDRPYAEAAAIMRCSIKSVESRLYRARRFLRQRLAPYLL